MFFNFIRGGQTLANRFRETIEVFGKTLGYASVITLVIVAVRFGRNVSFTDVKNTFNYYLAKI